MRHPFRVSHHEVHKINSIRIVTILLVDDYVVERKIFISWRGRCRTDTEVA